MIRNLLWGVVLLFDMVLGFMVCPPIGWLFIYPVYRELRIVFEVLDYDGVY